jgi:Uncharacterized NAD(FAD)-dependent dehydrogenases
MTKNIVVIGSGAAGMTAASTAKKYNVNANITVFTEDEHIAYSPCAIPWVIEGRMEWKDIVMHDADHYAKNGILVMTKTKVTAVDAGAKTVTANGKEYKYDSLIVATGGNVFIPPIPGKTLSGTFIVRTVNDCIAITGALADVKKATVIGAGVIGLEMAVALANRKIDVTVVEMMDQVIPRIADSDVADMVKEHLEARNIRFVFKTPIESVNGDGKVQSVTAGGKTYESDMVIFATGVRANLEIPMMLGLDVGMLGAVVVSPTLQGYRKGRLVSDIYLAGDVIQCQSAVTSGPTMSQLGSSAVKQGMVAGKNAAGSHATNGPTVSPWISVLDGLQVGGTGLSENLAAWYGIKTISATAIGTTCARYYPGGKKLTVKLLADASTHAIIGAQMIGDEINGRINWMSSVISSKTNIEKFIFSGENAYCPPTSMVKDVTITAAEALLDKLNNKQAF